MSSTPERDYIPTREDCQRWSLEARQLEARFLSSDTSSSQNSPGSPFLPSEYLFKIRIRRSWCAPIRRMPSEILGCVFEWCGCASFEELRDSPAQFSMSPQLAPMLLMQVCWRWRSVAAETPSLWNLIDMRDRTLEHGFHLDEIIPMWLLNSKQIPLDISIGPFRGDRGVHPATLALVQQELCRSRELYISTPIITGNLLLQNLEVFDVAAITKLPTGIIIEAPNLRNINMRVPLKEILAMFPISRSNVRSITTVVESTSGSELLQFLAQFPHLESFDFVTMKMLEPHDSAMLIIPNLTLLSISWWEMEPTPPVFPMLSLLQAPSLRLLHLEVYTPRSNTVFEDISNIALIRFTPSLLTLEMSGFDISNLAPALQDSGVLDDITMTGCIGNVTFVSSFIHYAQPLCRLLRRLCVHSKEVGCLEKVAELIKHRGINEDLDSDSFTTIGSDGVYPLRVVEVKVMHRPTEEEKLLLREMTKRVGVRVRRSNTWCREC